MCKSLERRKEKEMSDIFMITFWGTLGAVSAAAALFIVFRLFVILLDRIYGKQPSKDDLDKLKRR
jgi:hypothetical protein